MLTRLTAKWPLYATMPALALHTIHSQCQLAQQVLHGEWGVNAPCCLHPLFIVSAISASWRSRRCVGNGVRACHVMRRLGAVQKSSESNPGSSEMTGG